MSESPAPQRPSKTRLVVVGVIAILAAGALAARGILARDAQESLLKERIETDSIPTVSLIDPIKAIASEELVLPGSMQAYYDAPIFARVPGYLKKWYVDIGTEVKAGQILAEIETPELDLQLQQAKADLSTAMAKKKLAGITAKRWQTLVGSNSVSKQEADDKNGDFEAKDAEASSAQANVNRLETMSAFKRVIAPFDGRVTSRKTDIGALINAGGTGTELFHIADTRKLRIYIQVPQTYAAQIKTGMDTRLYLPERPGTTYAAKVVGRSGSINESSRTMLVQLEADNKDGELISGSYVDIHFDMAPAGSSLQLPVTALLFRQNGLEVATVGQDNKILLKSIGLGRDFGTRVEVVSGLAPHDKVVDSPPDWLSAGTIVHVGANDM